MLISVICSLMSSGLILIVADNSATVQVGWLVNQYDSDLTSSMVDGG